MSALWQFISFLLFAVSSCPVTGNKTEDVVITSVSQCLALQSPEVIAMDADTDYVLSMNLSETSCLQDPNQTGFSCQRTFKEQDPLEMVGSQLCVDVLGVAESMPDTQLSVRILDGFGELKRVYTTSRVLPGDVVCTREFSSSISISLVVRDSVKICPEILDRMKGHSINLGRVSAKKTLPTYGLSMTDCFGFINAQESAYILKVTTEGHRSTCTRKVRTPSFWAEMVACLEVVYISSDFRCNITVELSQATETLLSFEFRSSFYEKPIHSCHTLLRTESEASDDPVITIQKSTRWECQGAFALKASYSRAGSGGGPSNNEDDMDSQGNMRHMYMAVFISLISVCLLILGLTCLCCLRMRRKRLRRTQQRRSGAIPSPNPGYDTPPFDPASISWSPTESGQIVGLPSYEEVFGSRSDGVSPSQDDGGEKPPTYDSLFPTEQHPQQ